MINEAQLRRDLIQLIQGRIPLDEFEERLVRASWNMHQDSSASAIFLASAIELRLAEHSAGHLDEREMRDEFSTLAITRMGFDNCESPQTGSDVEFIDSHWALNAGVQFAGRPLEVECV